MKPSPVRPEDALQFLLDALYAPAKSKKRQALLEGALVTFYFGLLNKHKFKARSDRRGAPRGKRGSRHNDEQAITLMADIAARIGAATPHALARQAVKSGLVPLNGADEASVIRRLAGRWRQRVEK